MKPAIQNISVGPEVCPSAHGWANKLGRLVWGFVWATLFRPTPRWFCGWRRMLLRVFGARIGHGAKVMPSARVWAPWNLTMGEYACLSHGVDCYCVAPIEIGAHATVSQYSFLCAATHDETDPHMALVARPIRIGDQAWVAADVFVGPGVTIGAGTVVGARSSVFRDLPPWKVCHGTPARPVRDRVVRSMTPSP
jgi:putative colanic acid biosynthesis acetyltransferase WcaF